MCAHASICSGKECSNPASARGDVGMGPPQVRPPRQSSWGIWHSAMEPGVRVQTAAPEKRQEGAVFSTRPAPALRVFCVCAWGVGSDSHFPSLFPGSPHSSLQGALQFLSRPVGAPWTQHSPRAESETGAVGWCYQPTVILGQVPGFIYKVYITGPEM